MPNLPGVPGGRYPFSGGPGPDPLMKHPTGSRSSCDPGTGGGKGCVFCLPGEEAELPTPGPLVGCQRVQFRIGRLTCFLDPYP
jgi:hypothetical protein